MNTPTVSACFMSARGILERKFYVYTCLHSRLYVSGPNCGSKSVHVYVCVFTKSYLKTRVLKIHAHTRYDLTRIHLLTFLVNLAEKRIILAEIFWIKVKPD